MQLRYLSLFSGIEAASAAWGPLGWHCVGVAEIEPFPCAALAHHYPAAPNLGDVTLVTEAQIAALGRIDVLVFGSPCQDLSTAGKRKGLDGERSGLFFTAMRIVGWARKHCGLRFALWENVAGAFTSADGCDFAEVVGHMAGADVAPAVPPRGWGTEGCFVSDQALVEWSTLDAQWFGVAQRRRRVFALADFGDWASRPPVLLESDSLRGRAAPQRPGEEAAAADSGCGVAGRPLRMTFRGSWWDGGQVSQTLDAVLYKGQMMPEKNRFPVVLVPTAGSGETVTVRARRLTPLECERLFGMPDNYTLIPTGKKALTDTPRFKALGNTMCVSVMRWIGKGIEFATLYNNDTEENLFQ